MNRRILLSGVLAFLGAGACQTSPLGAGAPLFVLKEQSPWALVLGAESPIFALYDDGRVIFQKDAVIKSVILDRFHLDRLVDTLRLTQLPELSKHYEVAPFTDATTSLFFIFDGGRASAISVYGPIRARLTGHDGKPVDKLVPMVPAPIIEAYDAAMGFDHPKAVVWLPERVEVNLWPYEYAPDRSIVWPRTWPDLDDPTTVEHRNDFYSVYLPSSELPALKHFLSTQREKGAIEISGRKWAASLRYPFPKEEDWQSRAPPPRV